MPTFVYKALTPQGQEVTDRLEAPNRHSVMERLQQQSLIPVMIQSSARGRAAGRLRRRQRVSRNEIETFTRELANLLGAGVPLNRALNLLSREASTANARQLWSQLGELVSGGAALADAMAQFPQVFSSVNVAMVRAGETGGFLDVVLQQIADFRTREQELLGKVRAALVYPAILAVMATGVLIFLLTFFIPKFSTMFDEFGGVLPGLTRAIVAVSDAVLQYWLLVVLLLILAVVALQQLLARPAGRRAVQQLLLRCPLVGTAVGRFALVRFARMLGTLVGSAVPLVTALRTAQQAIGNEVLAETVHQAIDNVQRGQSLARSLALCPQLFPPSVVEMVTVAEESGRLDQELIRLADTYEQQLDRHLKMMVTLAEPALLFVMAVLVGTVVIGMLLPIFNLQELIR